MALGGIHLAGPTFVEVPSLSTCSIWGLRIPLGTEISNTAIPGWRHRPAIRLIATSACIDCTLTHKSSPLAGSFIVFFWGGGGGLAAACSKAMIGKGVGLVCERTAQCMPMRLPSEASGLGSKPMFGKSLLVAPCSQAYVHEPLFSALHLAPGMVRRGSIPGDWATTALDRLVSAATGAIPKSMSFEVPCSLHSLIFLLWLEVVASNVCATCVGVRVGAPSRVIAWAAHDRASLREEGIVAYGCCGGADAKGRCAQGYGRRVRVLAE